MAIWWIGNIVLLVAVVPVVVVLLHGVLKATMAVRRTVGEIAAVGGAIVTDLDPVPELLKTDEYASKTTAGLARYGRALDEIL